MIEGAITCDVDTLASIYKGYDLKRPGGYTYAEFRMGLDNFCRFLEPFNIKATLFMVGEDFKQPQNISYIKDTYANGHEIANHTFTHAQGFRLLNTESKEAEIYAMEQVCQQITGRRPVGFRSPGWNVSNDALPILKRLGYLYDSSIFPSLLNPLLKFLHWRNMNARPGGDRTTLGQLRYMLAPLHPYLTSENKLERCGQKGLVEFPVTVLPFLRLPFFATYHLATGFESFKLSFRVLKALKIPIQYQFHLSDFVDYDHTEFENQMPKADGVYVPQALRTPLKKKWELFYKVMDMMTKDYNFITLETWALKIVKDKI